MDKKAPVHVTPSHKVAKKPPVHVTPYDVFRKPPVHVTPYDVASSDRGWAVIREGNKRPSSVHPTQKQAAQEGRAMAQRDKTEFVLHGRDGQIRQKNTYGTDPSPPRG